MPEGHIMCEAYIIRSGTERISLQKAAFRLLFAWEWSPILIPCTPGKRWGAFSFKWGALSFGRGALSFGWGAFSLMWGAFSLGWGAFLKGGVHSQRRLSDWELYDIWQGFIRFSEVFLRHFFKTFYTEKMIIDVNGNVEHDLFSL